jgi:hypothetical protein
MDLTLGELEVKTFEDRFVANRGVEVANAEVGHEGEGLEIREEGLEMRDERLGRRDER